MPLTACPNCASTSWEEEQDSAVVIWQCTIDDQGHVDRQGEPQIEDAETVGYRCKRCRKFFRRSAQELAGVELVDDNY